MNTKRYEKWFKSGQENSEVFEHMAEWAVNNHLKNKDINDELKEQISKFAAENMSIGSAMTRTPCILFGTAIGVVGTTVAFKLYSKFKNRNNTEQKEVAVTLEEDVEIFEPEVFNTDNEAKAGKQPPKKDMGDLADIITEIDKHGKKNKR